MALEPFYTQDAHVVDAVVELHRGPPQGVTERGYGAIVDSYMWKVKSEWTGRQIKVLILCYDNRELVPRIKAHEKTMQTAGLQPSHPVLHCTCTPRARMPKLAASGPFMAHVAQV